MKAIRDLDLKTKLYVSGVLLLGLAVLAATAIVIQLGALDELGGASGASAELAAATSSLRSTVLVLLACGAGVAALLSRWLARELTRTLGEAVRLARAIADGRLGERAAVATAGQGRLLLATLEQTSAKLQGMIRALQDGSESIMRGAGEIASGNTDLSARTEQQAASLEQTASSMEELTSTVKQNAEHAHQASRLAISASEVAVKGGQVVSEVVGTMASINESSKRIAEIIGVIDGIAFQTNILALNAAVEAARAGEQGRGFAVVASEVRSLAQRSAAAAREIKELIDDSVEKVGAGTQLADKAGSTMQEVVTSVKRVTDIIAEIADASAEQTTGIEQVNHAIAAMDQATQQNAALVEQSAAAAAAMREQAAGLASIVAGFGGSAGLTSAPAGTPAVAAPTASTSAARAGAMGAPGRAENRPPSPVRGDKRTQAPGREDKRPPAPGTAPRRRAAASGSSAAVPDVDWEEF